MGFIKSTLGHLTGAKVFSRQTSYIKDDFSGVISGLKDIHAKVMSKDKAEKKVKTVDLWNTVVLNYGINDTMMKSQYLKRRIVSYLLLCTFFTSIYFVIVDSQVFIGLPAVCVSLIFYMSNGLRLYQIRQRELCPWSKYFFAIKTAFKELLPLSLPDDWQLMQTSEDIPQSDIVSADANEVKKAKEAIRAKKENQKDMNKESSL